MCNLKEKYFDYCSNLSDEDFSALVEVLKDTIKSYLITDSTFDETLGELMYQVYLVEVCRKNPLGERRDNIEIINESELNFYCNVETPYRCKERRISIAPVVFGFENDPDHSEYIADIVLTTFFEFFKPFPDWETPKVEEQSITISAGYVTQFTQRIRDFFQDNLYYHNENVVDEIDEEDTDDDFDESEDRALASYSHQASAVYHQDFNTDELDWEDIFAK